MVQINHIYKKIRVRNSDKPANNLSSSCSEICGEKTPKMFCEYKEWILTIKTAFC